MVGMIAGSLLFVACQENPTDPAAVSRLTPTTPDLTTNVSDMRMRELAGERIFFDKSLSLRGNQSCSSCHDPDFGFTSPNTFLNAHGGVVNGSIDRRFGNRRPPSAAYATFSPVLYYNEEDEAWVGGNFWDGRATGKVLGIPSADQALGPFVNPAEQASPDFACIVYKVSVSNYISLFRGAWGRAIDDIDFPRQTPILCSLEGKTIPLSARDRATAQTAYNRIALSLAAYEASPAVNAFNSRYDRWLDGRGELTAEERRGLELYNGKANCFACHPNDGKKALFTDFTYDNIGTPANFENPQRLANGFVDPGLAPTVGDPSVLGAQKVPTLRNLDKRPTPFSVKSYMHNGAFKSIEQVVHFYNTRDVLPVCKGIVLPYDPRFGRDCWPKAEVTETVNLEELGHLGMTPGEEKALVAYLRTLSDR